MGTLSLLVSLRFEASGRMMLCNSHKFLSWLVGNCIANKTLCTCYAKGMTGELSFDRHW